MVALVLLAVLQQIDHLLYMLGGRCTTVLGALRGTVSNLWMSGTGQPLCSTHCHLVQGHITCSGSRLFDRCTVPKLRGQSGVGQSLLLPSGKMGCLLLRVTNPAHLDVMGGAATVGAQHDWTGEGIAMS